MSGNLTLSIFIFRNFRKSSLAPPPRPLVLFSAQREVADNTPEERPPRSPVVLRDNRPADDNFMSLPVAILYSFFF